MGFSLGGLGDKLGGLGGGLFNETIGKLPIVKDISPAQFDPFVLTGITKTSPAGALIENTTSLLPMAGKIVGTAVGSAYGNPQLGGAIGEFAGGVAKGTINTTSDHRGLADLDGQETIGKEGSENQQAQAVAVAPGTTTPATTDSGSNELSDMATQYAQQYASDLIKEYGDDIVTEWLA